MPIPATLPQAKRKRGNPNWGQPMPLMRALPTEFELLVSQLHLTREMYPSSRELYVWCSHNKNRVYVPEWLLKEWNLAVEITFGQAA